MSPFTRRMYFAALFAAFSILAAQAVVPPRFSYQGYLTNAGGTPVNATVTMQFRLFDVPTGGSPAWSETQSVTVTNGVFNVVLGSVATIFVAFDKQYYLEMQVDPDPPMTPRQALQSVPYAAAAGFAGCGIGDYINCYSGPAGTEGVGLCKTGRRTCNPTTLRFDVCTGMVTPSTEIIDGIDNDCDGAIDNGAGPPSVSNVTASTANGTYGFNAPITIQVVFNEPAIVNEAGGPPQLALNSGGTATYYTGSGTPTLGFSYQVAAGHNTPDLDYTSVSALSVPPGSTVRDSSSNDASLTLPAPGGAGSLGFNKAIVIDTAGPTITNVTSTTANGTYAVGASISIQVTFSEAVYVGGLPQLALNSGGTATYESGAGTAILTFAYTVASGHSSPDLDYASTSALSLSGGSISDSVLNNALLALPTPGGAGSLGANKAIVIDTVPLGLSVTVTPTGAGTVTSTPPGIDCGADCSETYTSGTVVGLTATAAVDWTFSGWGGACSGAGTCNITMDAAKSVSAGFYQTVCDIGLPSNSSVPLQYAAALDLCQTTTEEGTGPGVISASLTLASGAGTPATVSRAIRGAFGSSGDNAPRAGAAMVVLSTGSAAASGQTNPAFQAFQLGSDTGTSSAAPADWLAANGGAFPNLPDCSAATSTTAYNPVMLTLRIRVPGDAHSFQLSARHFAADYPEWVCSPFNDVFVALLDSAYAGTPSNPVDKNLATYTAPGGTAYPLGVNLAWGNTGLFTQCVNGSTGCGTGISIGTTSSCVGTSALAGTGMELLAFTCGSSQVTGGATGWLAIRGNVVPGEIITLRLALWDTGDGLSDSVVLLDKFMWSTSTVSPGITLE